jgi:uncharacterized protein YndB with AHSA1/START domain
MLIRIPIFVVAGLVLFSVVGCEVERSQGDQVPAAAPATSVVSKTDANELILKQEVSFAASIEDVWRAYTTADGWTAWASPKAEIDLRVGGTIRTAYEGEIGGSKTNTLHIVNYVPYRLLTLRADVSSNWPEIMQEDAEKLSNVVLFDEIADGVTRIESFGIGYTDAPEYDQLMGFFIKGNESLYQNLRGYLETGARVDWGQ